MKADCSSRSNPRFGEELLEIYPIRSPQVSAIMQEHGATKVPCLEVLNLNTGLDVDDDLLDDLGGGVEAAKKVASVYWSCEPANRGKCGGICLTR